MRRGRAWLALTIAATIMAAGAVVGAAWSLVQGKYWPLIALPPAILFWYWIAAGAWRRSRHV